MTRNRGYDRIAALHGEEVFSLLSMGARILDIGSGEGVFAEEMRDKGYWVDAIDREANEYDCIRLDLNERDQVQDFIDNHQNTYDAVLSSYTSQYLDDPMGVLRMAHAVAKQGTGIVSYHMGYERQFVGEESMGKQLNTYNIPHKKAIIQNVDLFDRMGTRYRSIIPLNAIIAQYMKLSYKPLTVPTYKKIQTGLLIETNHGKLFPRHGDKHGVYELKKGS